MVYNVTLFASGNGSNVENIIKYFVGNNSIKILLVVCNNKDAFVLERTHKYKVSTKIISNAELKDGLLKVSYHRDIPEAEKPKVIEIKSKK